MGAVGFAAVVLGGFAIAGFAGGRPLALDQGWHDLLAGTRSGFADRLSSILNVVGGTLVMTIVTCLLVAVMLLRRRWWAAIAIGSTVALSTLASELLKSAIARPRPSDAVFDLGLTSYPSGHVTTAAAITVAVAIAFPHAWTRALVVVWIPLMAWSRTYLLVHWFTDVTAGALLGASVALLIAAGCGQRYTHVKSSARAVDQLELATGVADGRRNDR